MRYESLTESRSAELELEPEQAESLRAAGRRLASDRTWWGASDEDEDQKDRTVIRCRSLPGEGRYSVRVSDSVGVVSVPGLQLQVRPKIPRAHFLFLLAASDYIPRLDEQQASLRAGDDLFRLMARWFVDSLELLLRQGLIRDYSEERGFLSAKRGRIQPLRTATAYYRGRIGFHCEFDEFNTNTPLNRVVLAASRLVVRRSELPPELRHRARSAASRMPAVGELQPQDLRAKLTRRTAHYRNAVLLGRQLLRSEHRFLGRGQQAAWSFLIRTPELIEDGLRNLLREAFGDRWRIEKQRETVAPSVSFSPDLVFNDGEIIGDVKYKYFGSNWHRSDLYQILAFCTAFRSSRGIVVGFEREEAALPPTVQVGDVHVEALAWPVHSTLTPGEARALLVERVGAILDEQLPLIFPASRGAAYAS